MKRSRSGSALTWESYSDPQLWAYLELLLCLVALLSLLPLLVALERLRPVVPVPHLRPRHLVDEGDHLARRLIFGSSLDEPGWTGTIMKIIVLGIRIRVFLGLPVSDPLVRGMPEPDPDPSLFSQRCWADWNNESYKKKLWKTIFFASFFWRKESDPELVPDPDPFIRDTDPRIGSAPKCQGGSPTLKKMIRRITGSKGAQTLSET